MKQLKALPLLALLCSCSPPTPAQRGAAVKTAVDVARIACFTLLDPNVPREPATEAQCKTLVEAKTP